MYLCTIYHFKYIDYLFVIKITKSHKKQQQGCIQTIPKFWLQKIATLYNIKNIYILYEI